ncbi:MAG: OmpH family outer membrane protein [Bacteroidetes bacterium]|nr:OmpH family outer membrane protein [Bacteroidota bacterium]
MKKIAFILWAVLSTGVLFAQKYAYVDTDYILSNIPEYSDAQDILDEFAIKWQKEIEEKFAEIDQLYKAYQAEAVLLPEDMKKQRENEIIQKEKEAKDLQKQRFGREGDLFKKRQELVQPIQEKIYNAIETVAEINNYAMVFDKAGSLSLIFAKDKYDISDDILDEVGSVMQTVRREDRVRPAQTVTSSGQTQDNSQGVNKMINKLKDQ